MKLFIKGLALLLALLPVSVPATETAASKREIVEEMLVLMDVDAMVDTIYTQMDQMMQGMGREMGITPEDQPLFDKYSAKMTAIMRSEVSWQKMKEPIIAVYQNYFTTQELADMLAFYKSPSGQSMLKKMPEVMKASMVVSQDMMKTVIPQLQQLSQELAEEVKAQRAAKQGL